MIKIFLPINLNFIFLNNNFLYLYNKNLFILINLSNFLVFFNKHLSIIHLKKTKNLNKNKNKNFFNLFIFTWENFFFSKIYFLGKGFKLKKISNNMYFNFNHSHINLFICNSTILKKIQKNKILIFNKSIKSLHNLTMNITKIKSLSPYTKRGLRKTKQIIYKKRNKSNI